MISSNREKLKIAAIALGEACSDVVFVGGAVVELYATIPTAPDPRPTMDVDCIIEIPTRAAYAQLEEYLRRKGFVNDQSQGAPLCRWLTRGITIDVMPLDPEILGFSSEWYDSGFDHSFAVALGEGITIQLLCAPYFLATKLVAMYNRGIADLRTSRDFEDIVYVPQNRGSLLAETRDSEAGLRGYLTRKFGELRNRSDIGESVRAALGFGESTNAHLSILSIMEQIGGLQSP